MKKDKEKERDFTEEYSARNSNSIASANEFTGLISPGIPDEQQAEAYSEEFDIVEQKEAKD